MCGIVGILTRGTVDLNLLERATQSLAHRGPDDSGTIIIRATSPGPIEIGLGNRRLAVLDLSPLGHQPMQDPETGNWIVFNGEIYNFGEIRKELEDDGARFRSNSDTEVLLRAYGRWAEHSFRRLRGMFALAIWDARRHRLLLARDPMGIKPLYYSSSGAYFLFASELRTLLGTGLVPSRLDQAGLLNYLAFGSLYDPVTLIEGISVLQPGHYLIWESGTVRNETYWDLAQGAQQRRSVYCLPHRAELQHGLNTDIDAAVRMQLVSDVPIGVFLSGGIDSGCLAGILSRSGIRPNTFSVVFREQDYSEAEYSRLVARRFGTEHHEILVSQHDALEAIPSALSSMDQPTVDGLNTYFISRQARKVGIKVALSGLGADELFAGYSSFSSVPRMERFESFWRHLPKQLQLYLARAFNFFSPDTDQTRKLVVLAEANGNLLHPYFLSRMLFTPLQRHLLCRSRKPDAVARAKAPLLEDLERSSAMDAINRVSYLELRCYMLNTLLRDTDAMSMAHGVEIRVPFVDHVLAEKLLSIPGPSKLEGSVPKPLLVAVLGGDLPRKVVHRRKRGFTLPFEHWLRDELKSEVAQGLARIGDGPLASVLHLDTVRRVWENFQRGATSWSRPWSLYVLQRWCEINLAAV
jgi:asparagine synthase (glutamine-hydrolysing)